jgi:hypothetical protein
MSLFNDASLIVTPNGYKEGKIYSLKPFNGSGDLGFVRNTTATRVNSVGLVELVPYNLLTYSEMFNNVAWSKIASSVTVNATTAPNGTITADKLIEDSSNNQHRLDQNTTSVIGTNTFTVYAKKAERDSVWLRVGTSGAYFDLTNGTISGSSGVTASIESLPDGWYRCTILRITTVANEIVRINLAIGINGTYTGTIGNGLFIWGAQLNEGTLKDYFATETRLNIPRLDYSNGSCPSILVEPQRTNLALRSEEFDNISWQKLNGGVGSIPIVSANNAISPSGVQNADRIQLSLNGGTSGADISYINQVITSSSATLSIYLKSNTTACTIYLRNAGFTTAINVTNQWQRFTLYNPNAITLFQFGLRGGSYGGAVNSNTADISVWGAQLEAGAYATSYIPTVASAVTRNQDTFALSNVFTNNMISSAGGTWFVDLRGNVDLIRSASVGGLFLNTGTVSIADDGFLFRNQGSLSQKIAIIKYNSGTASTLYNTLTENVKTAIKWNGTTADVFVNGVKVVSATAFTTTAMQNLIAQGSNRNLNINAMALWPTPLTDAECIALTTL